MSLFVSYKLYFSFWTRWINLFILIERLYHFVVWLYMITFWWTTTNKATCSSFLIIVVTSRLSVTWFLYIAGFLFLGSSFYVSLDVDNFSVTTALQSITVFNFNLFIQSFITNKSNITDFYTGNSFLFHS